MKLGHLDVVRRTVLVATLVGVCTIASIVAASDLTHLTSYRETPPQPNVIVYCASGTYLADHHCVTNCPSGYSPVTWSQGESSVCMSPDNKPASIYDLAGVQVSSDNGRTVYLVVVNVPMTLVSITQQIQTGQMWGGYLPVSWTVLGSFPMAWTIPIVTTEVATVGDRAGMLKILSIEDGAVSGNVTFAYPLCCRQQATTIHVGDDVGLTCAGWSETLQTIDRVDQIAIFRKDTGLAHTGCPICLSGDTMIDTPSGPVNVKNLVQGMPVWTLDRSGARVVGTVRELRQTPVPLTDEIIHIVLADGRQLFASANHPTADGRTIGQLKRGVTLDGSTITVAEFVPYEQGYTYDLLPSGATGYYWANGILVGSTLSLHS